MVSTSIRDVVRPYGELGLVQIADTPGEWEDAITVALSQATDAAWQQQVDTFLATMSWDLTWQRMVALVQAHRQKN